MPGRVGVGGNIDAAQPQWPARHQPMGVMSNADACALRGPISSYLCVSPRLTPCGGDYNAPSRHAPTRLALPSPRPGHPGTDFAPLFNRGANEKIGALMATPDRTTAWPIDSTYVGIERPGELEFWSKRFRVSAGMLRQAVQRAGHRFKDVKFHIERCRNGSAM